MRTERGTLEIDSSKRLNSWGRSLDSSQPFKGWTTLDHEAHVAKAWMPSFCFVNRFLAFEE